MITGITVNVVTVRRCSGLVLLAQRPIRIGRTSGTQQLSLAWKAQSQSVTVTRDLPVTFNSESVIGSDWLSKQRTRTLSQCHRRRP